MTEFPTISEIYDEINEKYLNNKFISINCKNTSELFDKIKENKIDTKISIYPYKEPPSELLESNNLIDKIQYYRRLRNISIAKIAKLIGVDDETYSKYETKKIPFINPAHINIILEELDIKDKIEIPEFVKFIEEYPLSKIISIIKDEMVTKSDFIKKSGINREALDRWLKENGSQKIPTHMYEKLYLYWKKYKGYGKE